MGARQPETDDVRHAENRLLATRYGFTVDDGPFCYEVRGGEFEVKVKLTGQYRTRYDQTGLMLRINESTWIKTGVEFMDDKIYVSAVVTHERSDWSILTLSEVPDFLWIKAVRHLDSVGIFYSLDDETHVMFRLDYFPDHRPVMVGMAAASPDGEGFEAVFEDFTIIHLPDAK